MNHENPKERKPEREKGTDKRASLPISFGLSFFRAFVIVRFRCDTVPDFESSVASSDVGSRCEVYWAEIPPGKTLTEPCRGQPARRR